MNCSSSPCGFERGGWHAPNPQSQNRDMLGLNLSTVTHMILTQVCTRASPAKPTLIFEGRISPRQRHRGTPRISWPWMRNCVDLYRAEWPRKTASLTRSLLRQPVSRALAEKQTTSLPGPLSCCLISASSVKQEATASPD